MNHSLSVLFNTHWNPDKNNKQVYQFNKKWIFIKKYKSRKEASLITWVNEWNIVSNIKWKLKSAGWYIWKDNFNIK